MKVALLDQRLRFPDPRLANAEGLVAVGGELSVERLLLAYRSGIFPWTAAPVTWWSPDPRAIFELDGFHVSRSLSRVLRKNSFQVTVDRAFRQVMEGCASPAPGRRSTWISPEFLEAYANLHAAGHAHSLECWQAERLVGGIYGVAVGGLFAGESMFHRVSDASKIALFHLVRHLRRQGFLLFDIQMLTPITAQLGASSTAPVSYQWKFNGADLAEATASALVLSNVTLLQAGTYVVGVTNAGGGAASQPATLTITPLLPAPALSLLTYNVKGNGAVDWSTNTAQVQAIGRQLSYLHPDVITFNEIPYTNTWQMTNWVTAFLPGYYLATNSGTDGYIRSVIASRFPISRSQKWLDGVSLANFGYSGNFSRDLFEAQIAVPNFSQPLHVFVTHLKATTSSPQQDADKRAAEASAISNFFVTVFLTTNASHPYVLSGDMNEDILWPGSYTSGQPIQRLTSPPTGLQLTTPLNPITLTGLTVSIQAKLNVRFDYILPCTTLFSNIISSQVFRTDLLSPVPPPLLANDDITSSDHLPVMMSFGNPYATPFRMLSVSLTNQNLTLAWEAISNRQYRVEASSDLNDWSVFAASLTATGASQSFSTNVAEPARFYRVYRLP